MSDKILHEIHAFWFEEHDWKSWFQGGEAFDQELVSRWSGHFEAALEGKFKDWMQSARGCLGLCLLWDQFPRNAFRGTPRAFATDTLALAIARDAVARGLDQELNNSEKNFLYLPFEHAEHLAEQARSVALYYRAMPDQTDYAIKHADVVDEFGRFPGRNAAIGRVSTRAEVEFLASKRGKAF